MDGQDRIALITTDLTSPYGITIDYMEQKIYWVDAFLDKIEYSNTDGSNRVTLTTLPEGFGLGVPYSLTLDGDFLYWSEWDTNSLYSVHKTEGGNVSQIFSDLFVFFKTLANLPLPPVITILFLFNCFSNNLLIFIIAIL